jgi:hypothetical protein
MYEYVYNHSHTYLGRESTGRVLSLGCGGVGGGAVGWRGGVLVDGARVARVRGGRNSLQERKHIAENIKDSFLIHTKK